MSEKPEPKSESRWMRPESSPSSLGQETLVVTNGWFPLPGRGGVPGGGPAAPVFGTQVGRRVLQVTPEGKRLDILPRERLKATPGKRRMRTHRKDRVTPEERAAAVAFGRDGRHQ